MKAKILMLALVSTIAVSFGAVAQEHSCCKSAHKTIFNRDKGSAHWFLDLEGGVGLLPFGKANNNMEFKDRISVTPFIGVGKWHNPWFATRLQLNGWEMKGFTEAMGDKAFKNYYGMAHLQFIFDAVTYFENYCPKRFMRIAPFVGAGVAYRHKTVDYQDKEIFPVSTNQAFGDKASGSVNAGIMFRFRLFRWVDLNLEAQVMANNVNFEGSLARRDGIDISAFASAGLGFNLGKPEWTPVTPMDWDMVNDLNLQINTLRAENVELSKRPVSCPECPDATRHCPKCQCAKEGQNGKRTVRDVVYFRINCSKISKAQYLNIEKIAKYSKEFNAKIFLVGYADENTGTASGNMVLSENRVNAVADLLVNQYGISRDMIETQFKGDTEQPFETPEWNRVVIMTVSE